nr:stage II sporulation protein R [Neobacillus sp. Marseille-Q6967]
MNSKVLVWSYLIILSFATIFNLYIPKNEAVAKDSVVIPGDAIRLRILANSDSGEDQDIKRKVRDAVNAQITLWVQDLTSKEKAKQVLQSKLPEIQKIAEEVVAGQGSTQSVKVEFGEKVQFPTKLYGQFLYPAGEYQAILITLGEGKGANWWCVLYPPLCFLDFSNGVAVGDGFEEKPVKAAMVDDVEEEKEVERTIVEEEKVESTTVEEEEAVETDETVETDLAKAVKRVEKSIVEEPAPVVEETKKDINEEVKVEVEKAEEPAPVYTSEDEEPVKVKFFVFEIFGSLFN